MSQDNSTDRYQRFLAHSHLFGANAPFIEELYQRYLQDPESVEPRWQAYFEQLQLEPGPVASDIDHSAVRKEFYQLVHARRGTPSTDTSGASVAMAASKQVAVLQLINAYRVRGHQQAVLDPLGLQEQTSISELDPSYHALTEADMDTVFSTGSLVGAPQAKLRDILVHLQQTYCRSVGAEYMHITDTIQKRWVQQQLEGSRSTPKFSPQMRHHILRKLVGAEGLEQYLHTKYVGQKRFSLEGGETLIPLLDELIWRAGSQNVKEAVVGMAHRGRLNVLVNIMGKNPAHMFQEFEGVCDTENNTCGDVKYHQGFSSDMKTPGGTVHLALAFNPSHLEIVNPVVEGSVRARQHRRRDITGSQVLPVLIHGDAAFAGQGVVMETLNMSQARGFTTGGTVHLIINNQIGFTTSNPLDARSTMYCTEVARMIQAPVFHVNGDDPEAVVFVTQLALDYRQQFGRDVVIDLVCYRRHGHNEADEPAVTQPIMYQSIRSHETTVKMYARRLIEEGVVSQEEADGMLDDYRAMLDEGKLVSRELATDVDKEFAVDWSPYKNVHWTHETDTALSLKQVREIARKLTTMPDGFELHSRAARLVEDRKKMAAGESPLDWGFAENVAYGGLLLEGHPIRLSGQDSGRGTFFHRHAVFHNQKKRGIYVPLQNLSEDQAHFRVIDSLLSEEAVLGFEYGYASASPESLVIWEAQFGDFANGAQVVIDQFISAGEVKWGRLCGLVMFLPHGYDGQGPEHSSARLERFLQLCAGDNMQVVYPTTPAQMFHMLRRQALRPYRKPLVVMSPKSLLRHKLSTSSLDDLTKGKFEVVIDEIDAIKPARVKRIVVCTGKVYFDLLEKRREHDLDDVAIIRLEQLYPLPEERLAEVLGRYNQAAEIVWCQEEPKNQGAWYFIHPRLRDLAGDNQRVLYAGRPEYAAPAEGLLYSHQAAQAELVDAALKGKAEAQQRTLRAVG
ncbi:2-oxoglutarate dehydrogenase subunit E1 [Candidatus Tenderia electrophaga]|jgi:2-oxoglutarate dehydrogenase E1 component|uniref:2-oxoglutarate dehydrogenase E1 component n=1 Tax=Candidatus Tenderia electrophaga TaxID=1748243 RepID=A0A0S2TCP7_9GAMM|nr:2-oxoglutarate dehydrogenase subunit E1 [Candidatus Tenderia electrophaga]